MNKFFYYAEMGKKGLNMAAGPKLWNYLKYRSYEREPVMDLRRYGPQIASLSLTSRCNLDCDYCCVGGIINEGRADWRENEATLEKIKRIFSNPWFANVLVADLAGGEPLLVSDLARIVVYLRRQGRMASASTNGLLLAERVLELKRAGISRINVSMYEANRRVLERDLVKINKVFPTHASYVLLRSEVEKQPDKILEIARFARDAGSRCLRFSMYRPMGVKPQPEEVILDSSPAYREFRRRAEEALPGFLFFPPPVKSGALKKRCRELWQRISCDMSGRMIVCCGVDKPLNGPDNLFEAGPAAYNRPVVVSMRKQLLDPACDPPEICKTCNLLGDPGW